MPSLDRKTIASAVQTAGDAPAAQRRALTLASSGQLDGQPGRPRFNRHERGQTGDPHGPSGAPLHRRGHDPDRARQSLTALARSRAPGRTMNHEAEAPNRQQARRRYDADATRGQTPAPRADTGGLNRDTAGHPPGDDEERPPPRAHAWGRALRHFPALLYVANGRQSASCRTLAALVRSGLTRLPTATTQRKPHRLARGLRPRRWRPRPSCTRAARITQIPDPRARQEPPEPRAGFHVAPLQSRYRPDQAEPHTPHSPPAADRRGTSCQHTHQARDRRKPPQSPPRSYKPHQNGNQDNLDTAWPEQYTRPSSTPRRRSFELDAGEQLALPTATRPARCIAERVIASRAADRTRPKRVQPEDARERRHRRNAC